MSEHCFVGASPDPALELGVPAVGASRLLDPHEEVAPYNLHLLTKWNRGFASAA